LIQQYEHLLFSAAGRGERELSRNTRGWTSLQAIPQWLDAGQNGKSVEIALQKPRLNPPAALYFFL